MTSTGSSSTAPAADAAGQADVLIGIPAYNQVRTVDAALEAARASAVGHLHGVTTAIVLVDGGSTDGTRERAAAVLGDLPGFASLTYPVSPGDVLSVPFHGLPGRPHAVAVLFEAARARGARACVLLDAGATGLTAEGLARLTRAVLDDAFDYAAATYLRPAYAGALSTSIVAPAFRACYGVRLTQPMAGEFACSAGLVGHCLDPDAAIDTADPVGVNLRLATTATTGPYRVCEVVLGVRSGASREDALDLGTTLSQVVGALFTELERTASAWQRIRRSVAPPIVGPVMGDVPAAHSPPDVLPLVEAFRLGYRELRELWLEILPPSSILALKRLAALPEGEFRVDDALWARTVYDFALAHRLRAVARDPLLRSLTPLYLGWLASFILAIRQAPARLDERVEQVSVAFEAEKPHLISGWRWPERFAPARIRR